MLDWSWFYLMPFSIPAAKKILHNFERQQLGQQSLILAELAAMKDRQVASLNALKHALNYQPSL